MQSAKHKGRGRASFRDRALRRQFDDRQDFVGSVVPGQWIRAIQIRPLPPAQATRHFSFEPNLTHRRVSQHEARVALEAAWGRLDRKVFSTPRTRSGSNFHYSIKLLGGDAVIPVQELINRSAAIQMFEKSLHGNSRSSKDQGAAHYRRILRKYIA